MLACLRRLLPPEERNRQIVMRHRAIPLQPDVLRLRCHQLLVDLQYFSSFGHFGRNIADRRLDLRDSPMRHGHESRLSEIRRLSSRGHFGARERRAI